MAAGSTLTLTAGSKLVRTDVRSVSFPAGTVVTVQPDRRTWRLDNGTTLDGGSGTVTVSNLANKLHVPSKGLTQLPNELGRTCAADFTDGSATYQADPYAYDPGALQVRHDAASLVLYRLLYTAWQSMVGRLRGTCGERHEGAWGLCGRARRVRGRSCL
jgi:hypothetical protein